MPDWTENRIYIEGTEKDIKAIKEGLQGEHTAFDLNHCIKMPDILKNTGSGSCTIDGQKVTSWIVENEVNRIPTKKERLEIAKIGFDNWYKWSCANWDTKWNTQDAELLCEGDNYLEYSFNTAWCAPVKAIKCLRDKYPDAHINAQYLTEEEY